jgi:hypothetical protein
MTTRDKLTWLAIAALIIFAGGFALALIITNRPAPSASTTVRRTLVALILMPILLVGGGLAIKSWWERYRKRQRLEDALRQAEVYDRLQGGSSVRSQARRHPSTAGRERGDSINIVLPGGRDYPRVERGGWYGE